MLFTVKYVQFMVTNVLQDWQYMLGVRSLLVAQKNLDEKKRPGRHVMVTTDATIATIDECTRPCSCVSVSDIVSDIGISQGLVHTVVHNHLKFQTVFARWVPKQLIPEQQATQMVTSLDNLQHNKMEGEAMLELTPKKFKVALLA